MGISLETYALAKKYTKAYVDQHGGGSSGGEVAPGTAGTITIGSGWSGNGPYTQSVTASGYMVSENTRVDLVGDSDAIAQMISDGVGQIYIVNDNGSLTAYAIGGQTTESITFQAIFSEVT